MKTLFQQGEKYRHNRCLDVDIIIVSNVEMTKDYAKLKVIYWNRHYNQPIDMEVDRVTIKKEEFKNWKQV